MHKVLDFLAFVFLVVVVIMYISLPKKPVEHTYTLHQIRPAAFRACHTACGRNDYCSWYCLEEFWRKLDEQESPGVSPTPSGNNR